jgi:hypothetical protein
VSIGEILKIKLPIVGKGPFTIKLTKDGDESEAPRFRISEIDGVATLTLIGEYFFLIFLVFCEQK